MKTRVSADLVDIINAYNAAVRAAPPRRRGLLGFIAYFFARKHEALGRTWTLWTLEREIRRRGDPRIHFALNCGASSCPPFREYHAATLNEELDIATRAYLVDPCALRFDAASRTLHVSRLFKWYRRDFGEPIAFLRRYLDPATLSAIDASGTRLAIRFLPWSWAPPGPTPDCPIASPTSHHPPFPI